MTPPKLKEILAYCQGKEPKAILHSLQQKEKQWAFEFPDKFVDCLGILESSDEGQILILDWTGAETTRILEAAKSSKLLTQNPTILIVEQFNPGLLSILTDYSINVVISKDLTAEKVHKEISRLMDPKDSRFYARNKLAKVNEWLAKGNQAMAKVELTNIYEANPNNPRIAIELAAACLQMGEWEAGEKYLNEVLDRHDDIPRAHFLKASCLMHRGVQGRALQSMRKSTHLNPYSSSRLVHLGEILLQNDNIAEATEAFKESLDLNNKESGAIAGLSKCNLLSGDESAGLDLLAQLGSERERVAVFNNAGVLAAKRGEYPEALRIYEIAESIVKDDNLKAKVLFNKAILYVRQKDIPKALKVLEEADRISDFARVVPLMNRLSTSGQNQEFDDEDTDILEVI